MILLLPKSRKKLLYMEKVLKTLNACDTVIAQASWEPKPAYKSATRWWLFPETVPKAQHMGRGRTGRVTEPTSSPST